MTERDEQLGPHLGDVDALAGLGGDRDHPLPVFDKVDDSRGASAHARERTQQCEENGHSSPTSLEAITIVQPVCYNAPWDRLRSDAVEDIIWVSAGMCVTNAHVLDPKMLKGF